MKSANPVVAAVAILAIFLAGCAAPPAPERPAARDSELDFSDAVAFAVDDLFIQLQRLPEFAPTAASELEKKLGGVLGQKDEARRGVIVVDTIIDSATGQQTHATKLAEDRLYERVRARFSQFEVGPAKPELLRRAGYVVAATMTQLGGDRRAFRLSMSMTDVRAGLVIAQAVARVRDASVDTTPTPYYRESPSVTRDRVVEGQVRTSETAPGKAADSVYLERLPTNALINEGLAAVNDGKYAAALPYYDEASRRGDGQQLRVYNGLYVAYWNLGRTAEAESAFGRIVALGLATNNLAVKFLFRPRSTEFWPDPKISGPYPFWLKQIAGEVATSKRCLAVIGHSSRTGSEQVNDRLSLQRAEAIKAKLVSESGELGDRIQTSGAGYRENLIGTGTDDLRDALDRRVEFRVVSCS